MRLAIIATAIFAASANAQIYKCTVNGVELFSQQPCAPNAATVTVTEASPQGAAVAAPASTGESKETVARYIERQRIERDIARTETEIKAADQKMRAVFTNARESKARAASNIAGAQWEVAISQEMQAAVAEYELALQLNLAKLEAQHRELASLNAADEKEASALDAIAAYNASEARKRKAAELEAEMAKLQQQLKAEVAALDSKLNTANNNWAGSVWAESIRLEKQAVTTRYTSTIKLKQSELLRLRY